MKRSSSRSASSLALGSVLAVLGCAAAPGSQVRPTGDSDAGVPGSVDAAGSTDAAPVSTNAFDCSGTGIAAYADQLVNKARVSCTADGVGVVKEDDYTCMSSAIDQVNPPYTSASFNVVSTLLANNTQYPFYECTWTDYPFACEFIDKPVQGFQWIAKANGVVQVGDILLYKSSDGCNNDPGHIMIVAQVIDSNHFRIAEANDLTVNGTRGTTDTGVVSNTRIQTLDDPYLAAGWFRHTGS